jgi:hypothetical protein
VENDIRSEDHTDGVRGLRHTDAMDAPVATMDDLYAHAAHAKPLFDGVVRGLADAVGVSNPHYVVTLPLKARQAHSPSTPTSSTRIRLLRAQNHESPHARLLLLFPHVTSAQYYGLSLMLDSTLRCSPRTMGEAVGAALVG